MLTAAALKEFATPYPLIDADPHFRRVVRYFRPSDYGAWAGAAAAFPGALWLMESASPTRPRRGLGPGLRLAATLGVMGGFLLAYQRASFRFWGWSENEREQSLASKEKESGDVPGFGKSSLSEEVQGSAFRNSLFSQLNFGVYHGGGDGVLTEAAVIPWFNFVNHKYHTPGGEQEN